MTTLIDIEEEVKRVYGISNFRTSSIAGWIDTQSLVFEDWPKNSDIPSLRATGELPKLPFLDDQEVEITFQLVFTKDDKTLITVLTACPPDGISLSIPGLSLLHIKDLQLVLSSRITQFDMDVDFGEPIQFDSLSASFGCTICLDTLDIPILIRFPLGDSTEWTMEGDFECLTLASGLGELTQLAGSDASWLNALPPQITQLGNFSFHNVRMIFDPTVPSISLIALEIASITPMEIIPGKLALEDPRIYINIDNPTDSAQRSIHGSFSGTVQIGGEDGVGLYLSADVPGMRFYGALAEGSSVNFTKLLGQLLPEVPLQDAPNIELHDFNLRVDASDPDAKTFSIYARCYSDWEIIPGISFTCVQTAVEYDSNNGVGATLISVFDVGGVDVTLSAAHPKGDAGWQFEGSTGAGQEIPIGQLLEDLAGTFRADKPELPTALANLVVQDLSVSFNTKSMDFKFSCESSSGKISSKFDIDIKHQDGNYELELGGNFEVELEHQALIFDLKYKREEDEKEKKKTQVFVASYHHTGEQSLCISGLVELTPNEQGLQDIIKTLDDAIDLKSVLFVYYKETLTEQNDKSKTDEPAKFLFGLTLDIGASVDLSGLPLVGDELASLGIEDLQILIASQSFASQDVTTLNGLLPEGVTRLPAALAKGINLSALLKLGEGESTPLLLSPSGGEEPAKKQEETLLATDKSSVPAGKPPALEATTPSVKWIKIQKSFGPVRFERIGFQFESPKQVIWFLLDASLTAAGLTISLDGLGFGSSITEFDPQFNLNGLGIYFKRDQVEIGGNFIKIEMSDYEYGGKAILKTEKFSLSAIGLYACDPGQQPSMFIYAFLDYPLGGPPVFYVTGLAAGFGYNRTLLMPAIDQVAEFPLIEEVTMGESTSTKPDPGEELQKLGEYVPVQTGQYFLAAGVRFTSFKMIDSFALLAVSFGQRLEIEILGLSTIKIPPSKDKPCLSEIKVAFKASYIPDDGILKVIAQLTSDSYILSKDNHPTGGLAFYSWFAGEHAGDFVLSVGGYHSKFNVPAHYPQVPRLALSWQVTPQLSIKGNGYFALTPSVLMAGGNLEACWHSGSLEAWFKAQVDFLIAWKPFHYDATMYVNMGIAYTFSINTWFGSWTKRLTAELGTDLHIWGPDFSGIARIKVSFISFSIAFGAGASQIPGPIEWEEFKSSFLPDDILTISVRNGLISRANEDKPANGDIDLGVIDPKDFSLVVDSAIPVKKLNGDPAKYKLDGKEVDGTSFGVAPMDLKDLESNLVIKIQRLDGDNPDDCTRDFQIMSIPKNVPAGLWGTNFNPDLNSDPMVKDVISGFEITVKPIAESLVSALSAEPTHVAAAMMLESQGVSMTHVAAESGIQEIVYSQPIPKEQELDLQWEQDLLVSTDLQVDPINIIQDSLKTANGRRQEMLAALGFESDVITIKDSLAEAFVAAPQIEG